jgi:hypothetical protein
VAVEQGDVVAVHVPEGRAVGTGDSTDPHGGSFS